MEDVAIKCRGIKKSYGKGETKIEALKGIDIDVPLDKLTLLVGPSSSGKSTLLSIITTILTPDEGQLFLLGRDISQMAPDEKSEFCLNNLGVVFQSLFLIPTLTVLENVSLPLLIAGDTQDEITDKAMDVLDRVGIAHRYDCSPENLSKGQQQRVAIARGIINDSKILVLDEPTSALDQASGLEIMSLLKDLAYNTHRCVFLVTHDPRTFSYGDEIIRISDGKIVTGKDHV